MNAPKLTWDDFASWWKLTFRRDVPMPDIAAWKLLVESHGVLAVQGSIKPGKMPKPKQVQKMLRHASDPKTVTKSADNAYLQATKPTAAELAQIKADEARCEEALAAIFADASLVAGFRVYLDSLPMREYFRKVWPADAQPDMGARLFLAVARQWYFGGETSAF